MEDIYGDESLEEIEYKGHTITIKQDSAPCESPRDWDNLGIMAIIHSRYTLGDTHAMNARQLLRICDSKDVVALPIFMLDHSGITIRTSRFDCPWDSGQCGIIYVTKAAIRQEYGWKRVSAKRAGAVRGRLIGEVSTYDLFIRGEVYGYEITDAEGDCVDSCWGFITEDIDVVIQEAKDFVDAETEDDAYLDFDY